MARPFSNKVSVAKVREARTAIARALPDAADIILKDSNRRVPEDTGDLKRSGKVVEVSAEKVAVTYTDRGAVAAHEKLEVTPANGRERKYLESAMNGTKSEVRAALIAAAKRVLR